LFFLSELVLFFVLYVASLRVKFH